MCYTYAMVKTLEQAIAQVARLPESDQEMIGRKLLSHVEKLEILRADIDAGIHALDEGEGTPLDEEAFLREVHEAHGRR